MYVAETTTKLFKKKQLFPPQDPSVDGRIILKWIFRKWGHESGSGYGQVVGLVNAVMNLRLP